MRRSARFVADMQDRLRVKVVDLKEHLERAQREVERARNAAAVAITTAVAAGAADEDLVALRAARDAIDASPAGEQLLQLEREVEALLPGAAPA